MKTTEERLHELEFRVQNLEHEIRTLRSGQTGESMRSAFDRIVPEEGASNRLTLEASTTFVKPASQEDFAKSSGSYPQSAPKSIYLREESEEETPVSTPVKKYKDNESLVGKYFIGILASLLIFIAAASFVAIVWNKISPEIKLAVVSVAGLSLTVVGLKMTLDKASNVSSILFGTGIGLVYIAILSASLVFSLVRPEVSGMLSVLWTILILFSHRYTKLYLTIVIASIGSFVTLWFELGYVKGSEDIMLVVAHTCVVSVMLLYLSNSLDKIRNLISIFFAFFSFTMIFLKCFDFWSPKYPAAQVFVTLIMLLLTNWMYRLSNRENMKYLHFIVTPFTVLFLFLTVAFTLPDATAFDLTLLQSLTVCLILLLTQFIVNHVMYPNIERPLTIFYAFPLYLTLLAIYDDLFQVSAMGAPVILLLFIMRKKVWNKAVPIPYMMVFVLADLFLSFGENTFGTLFVNTINLFLLFYLLYEEETDQIFYKNIAVGILLLGFFKISDDLCDLTKWDISVWRVENFLAHLMGVLTVMVIYKIGYLNSKDEKQSHLHQHFGLYLFSVFLYFFGVREMLMSDTMSIRFLVMLATLVIALFQSRLLIMDYEEIPNHIGLWLVVKYFLFTWAMLRAFWVLPLDSVIYSVVGLVLAVAAIYAGFKFSIKSIRQFGLVITLLMVAKFIFVDLQGENSITRVVAFAAGGVLCFIISIIYNRLSKE